VDGRGAAAYDGDGAAREKSSAADEWPWPDREWPPKAQESDVLASRLLPLGRKAAPPSTSASSSGRPKGMAVPVDGGTAGVERREAGMEKRAVALPEGGGETEPPSALTPRVARRFSGGGGRGRPAEKADDSRMSWRRCRRMVRSPAGGANAMAAEPGRRGGGREQRERRRGPPRAA